MRRSSKFKDNKMQDIDFTNYEKFKNTGIFKKIDSVQDNFQSGSKEQGSRRKKLSYVESYKNKFDAPLNDVT